MLTTFPYRQAGWMGKRGTNQAHDQRRGAGGVDRLLGGPAVRGGHQRAAVERFGTERLEFAHPCGIPYPSWG